MIEKLKNILRSKKGGLFLLLIGIIGMILVYLSTGLKDSSEEENTPEKEQEFSESEYSALLEKEIKVLVAAISGDTEAVVTVTLEGGITYVYAEDKKQNNKTEETDKSEATEQNYIIVKDKNGDEHPLIVTTKLPEVRGVAIVCNHIGEAMSDKIKNAVTAALGIPTRKVYITNKVQ